ncbi:hypothetical protein U1Q18_016095 [Sarracenia purpurea var. burkii]
MERILLPIEQRSRFGPEPEIAIDPPMGTSLELLEIRGPGRGVHRLGPGQEPEDFFEERLVAGNHKRASVGESVLILGLGQEVLENRVVQVRRANHESSTVGSHTDGHVSGGYVRR